MHPSIRESLIRARAHGRAKCLGEALLELTSIGARVSFDRPTRAGWSIECVVENVGAPSLGVNDCPFLALDEALGKLVKRTHGAPAEAA